MATARHGTQRSLLALVTSHVDQIVTRMQVLARVWHKEPSPESMSLSVHLRWLHEKCEVDPARPPRLQTLHERGDVFLR